MLLTSLLGRISRHPAKRLVLSLSSLRKDPAELVEGLTKDRAESDPVVMAYLQANYPEIFVETKQPTMDKEPSSPLEEETFEPEPFSSSSSSSSSKVSSPTVANSLNIRPLTCYLRDPGKESGTRSSEQLRFENLIPGLLYGGDPTLGISSQDPGSKIFIKTPWKLLQSELDRYHRAFECRVYDLTLLESPDDDSEGTVHRVIPQNVQRHPVKDSVYCVNYCRYHAKRPIKIPLVQVNQEESPALKRDGYVLPIQRVVECFVEDGVPIPEKIELECTGLQFKDVIRRDRLLLPEGVRFSDRVIKKGSTFIVGVVHGRNRGGDGSGEDGADDDD